MKGKRLMAIILSAVLTMTSMSSVAFAEDTYDAEAAAVVETEMVAEYEEPVVVEEETVPEVEEVVEETEIEVPVEEQYEITEEEAPVEVVETPVEEAVETVYPAQSFASAANGISVEVNAPEGAFPENTTMYVAPANYSAVVAAAEAVDAPVEEVKAVDITFMNAEGAEIEPLSEINVSLKSNVIAESNEAVIVHVDDNNVAEVVTEDKIVEESYNEITFAADEFSVYAIVPNDPRAIYEFYVDGVLAETQIVKAGDELVEPAEPAGEGHFLGWFNGDAQVVFGTLATVSAGQTVRVDARFENTVYVTFYDADRTSVVAVKIAENGSVETDDVTAEPNEANKAFDGWATADGTKVGANYAVTSSTSLYPVFVSGNSLIFDANGDGATQTPIQYVKAGQKTVAPADPQRPGYTFDGWYVSVDEDADPFAFGSTLSADTTIYAHWNPAAANYTVIIWKQKITDKAGSDDKHYDYEMSEVVESATGATVAVATKYQQYQWNGFHYAKCDSEKTVANDGSTVLNVYYDRNIITMTFKGIGESQPTYTVTTGNNGTQYGYVNGEYVVLTKSSVTNSYLSTSYYGNEYTGNVYTRSGRWPNYKYTKVNPPYSRNTTYYSENQSELRWIDNTVYTYSYNGETYTGTRYTKGANQKQAVYVGLYGQTLESQGYEWPAKDESGNDVLWNDGKYNIEFRHEFTLSNPTDVSATFTVKSPGSNPVRFYQQDVNGNWNTTPTNTAMMSTKNGNYYINDMYEGFTAYQYRNSKKTSWMELKYGVSDGIYYLDSSKTQGQTGVDWIEIRYKRNTYNLTFSNGSQNTSIGYLYQAELNENDAPTDLNYPGNAADAEHYSFAGWYADPEGTTPFDFTITMPANNLVAYAKWEPEKVTVTYDANGGTTDKSSEEINYNAKATGSNATWEGHSFLGWETVDGNTWNFDSPVTGNLTLKAKWHNDSKMHIAYVDADGETILAEDNNEYIDGARGVVSDYTDEEGRFIGWALNDTIYYAGDMILVDSANDTADGTGDGTVTLTAVYDELLSTSIIFNANGGAFADAATEKTVTLENNEGVDLDSVEVPVKEGYKFLGWAETADAEEATYTADGTAAEEIAADANSANKLYAIWIGQFKVYHSSDCSVEEYDLVESFDITDCVYSGYMYGGYYSEYADEGTPYTGASSSWSAANAYTTSGAAMAPVAGETYYLKEVPEAYVQAANYEIYHAKTLVEKAFYLVTTIDDANYGAVGFKVGSSMTDLSSTLTGSFVVNYTDPANSDDYYNESGISASAFNNVPGGLIAYTENKTILTAGKSVTYRPYYVTLDGITVLGKLQRTAKSDRKVNPVRHDSITITNKAY